MEVAGEYHSSKKLGGNRKERARARASEKGMAKRKISSGGLQKSQDECQQFPVANQYLFVYLT